MHRDVGIVANSLTNKEDNKTLDDIRLVAGDYLDVAIYFGPSASAIGTHQRTFGNSNYSSRHSGGGRGLVHGKKF